VTFYDLTNTFFEGATGSSKAKRGRSKEKRSDCPLVTLALVLDAYGYVIRSDVFAGNVSEPSALETMLGKLQATDVGQVVMDRGVATASNIQWLNEHNYSYLVVNREQKINFNFDKATPFQTKNKNTVHFYKELNQDNTEARLYCYSENRGLKESSIWAKKAKAFEDALVKIDEGLQKIRCQKELSIINIRIGRLFEKNSGIAQHYTINILDNSSIKKEGEPTLATKINWTKKPVSGSMMEQPGVYCLKSNNINMSAEEMWLTYSKLTDIESVFRSLKSELGLRPIFHQKEERIESHLFITVLAYQCVQVIRQYLKSSGVDESWASIRNCLASHGRLTFILPGEEGSCEWIRKTLKPESWQSVIYRALRVTMRPGGIVKRSQPIKQSKS
jgi:transposase